MTWKDGAIAFLDTETTGFDSESRIVEISVLIYDGRKFATQFSSFINPGEIDWDAPSVVEAMKINSIDREALLLAKPFSEMWPSLFVQLNRANILVGQFVDFDIRMICQELDRTDFPLSDRPRAAIIDTVVLDWALHPDQKSYSLDAIAERWGLAKGKRHRAAQDAELCAQILMAMMPRLPDGTEEFLTSHWAWKLLHQEWRQKREVARRKEAQK